MDLYFWGDIKAIVQKKAPTNMQDLKEAIRQAFEQVSRNNLDSAFRSFEKRLDLCVSVDGNYFELLYVATRKTEIYKKKSCEIKL